MVVKVYGAAQAACPQRVMACLLEKDIPFDLVHVDLPSAQHKLSSFLLKQPFGLVPAIEDGDFRLFESRAIMRYYATKYEERGPNLLGKTLEEKAIVDQWVEVEAHNFNNLVYNIVIEVLIKPKMGEQGDINIVKSCEHKLDKVFDVYEERLSSSKYLGGDYFTLADLTHMPSIRYLVHELGLAHLVHNRNKVNAWWIDISDRPAWKNLMILAGY
uniref:glutathione transferase n=1 Tax=Euphorbia pulcherrima TaxID=37495 RepID=A0A8B0SZJ6_EUPPU|nr:glutathione S-transferase [Euphorbia pulcherrima]QTX16313.1 glutathione S-transferase [Euphorbia pulcherrima]QTX16314.1 glutathione S-transferase [Euphorbia pulcherrima]QTX16316.1 glutathione S-transferase [Euphorbia pulcherrima]QTX16317.1 glutathione S-transferase [Euphorbia pulcherrima]